MGERLIYNSFFGFNEEPFGVTPDPKFLYISKTHEEAIAHLNYGISQNRGFIMLTGEVGTGKTTLIRHFLNTHGDGKIHSSLILNPKVEPLELLKLINHDFGIEAGGSTYKELMDSLNAFVLECFEKDETAVLIIDEAQQMSAECLEFIRLLSNLETDTRKLMQIILVGQTELKDIVRGETLRQLNQRIAVRYHIEPLDIEDTERYIKHRLNVAGSGMIKFPREGVKAIHLMSAGIPRLINLISDRTLMAAYSKGESKISRSLIKGVIEELKKAEHGKSKKRLVSFGPAASGLLFFAALSLLFFMGKVMNDHDSGEPKKNHFAVLRLEEGIYRTNDRAFSRKASILSLLSVWQAGNPNADATDEEIQKLGFSIYNFSDPDKIIKFGMPAVLELKDTGYITLRWAAGKDTVVLDPMEGKKTVPLSELKTKIADIQLIYKNKYNSGDRHMRLQESLRKLGFFKEEPSGVFGPKTKKALVEFQRRNGLEKTGVLDEETAILLSRDPGNPSLTP
jgi:general secretion pathway protein A